MAAVMECPSRYKLSA